MLSRLGRVSVFKTPGTVAHQAPLSLGFSRQEDWSVRPRDWAGIEPASLKSPALGGGFFTASETWEASWEPHKIYFYIVLETQFLKNSWREGGILSERSFILFLYFGWGGQACGILIYWQGIERIPPALEAQSLNHWTTREIFLLIFF